MKMFACMHRILGVGTAALVSCSGEAALFLESPPVPSGMGSIIFSWPTDTGPQFFAFEGQNRWEQTFPATESGAILEAAVLPRSLTDYGLPEGALGTSEDGVPLSELGPEYFVAELDALDRGFRPRSESPEALSTLRLPAEIRCPRLKLEHAEPLTSLSNFALGLSDGQALISGAGTSAYLIRAGRIERTFSMPRVVTGGVQTQRGEVLLLTSSQEVLALDLESGTTTVAFSVDLEGVVAFRWASVVGSADDAEIFAVDPTGHFARLARSGSAVLAELNISGEQVNHCGTLALGPSEALAVCASDTRVYRYRDGEVTTVAPGGLPLTADGLPSLIRTGRTDRTPDIVLVNEGGVLLELEAGDGWRQLPPSGIATVTSALAHGHNFVLGTQGGFTTYFLPEWRQTCSMLRIPIITEVHALTAHDDGFLIVGRSGRSTSAWAFVRIQSRI